MARRYWEDARWRNIRKQKLTEYPVCELCNRAKATEVHHILAPKWGGSVLSFDNLLSLCHECHRSETARIKKLFGRT